MCVRESSPFGERKFRDHTRRAKFPAAHDDAWADTAAQFGAAVEAGPVYQLFGLDGVGSPELPGLNSPRHAGAIGFHVRPGGHNLLVTDWNFYMDFADRHWNTPAKR